jgi:DNA-binding NarL/FixJ family response regulator
MTEAGAGRILIVDDHPIVRQGLAQLIAQEKELEVCGEADDAATALEAVRNLAPDVAVLDLMLKGSNGVELIREMKSRNPSVRILVISMHDEAIYAERALKAGAHGYIMKQKATDEVLSALRKVLAGEVYVSDEVIGTILRRMVGGAGPDTGIDRLSDRELEVFQWIGQGLSVSEIADKLKVSPKTVETYRSHIKEKLGLSSANDVLRVAVAWLENRS